MANFSMWQVESPFSLSGWLDRHRAEIQQSGSRHLFPPGRHQSDITVLGWGAGARTLPPANTEAVATTFYPAVKRGETMYSRLITVARVQQ